MKKWNMRTGCLFLKICLEYEYEIGLICVCIWVNMHKYVDYNMRMHTSKYVDYNMRMHTGKYVDL